MLIQARRTNRSIDEVPEHLIPGDAAAAGAVDDRVAELSGWPVLGWKIGCTSHASQQVLKTGQPFAGRIYSVLGDGADLTTDQLPSEPFVEAEFAFRIGQQIAPTAPLVSRSELVASIATTLPALEVVGGRYTNMIGMSVSLLGADAGINTHLVLGEPNAEVDPARLIDAAAEMRVDDAVTGSGSGADVLGDPINALLWLAAQLHRRGIAIEPGQVITTGTATGLAHLPPGSSAKATLEGVGTVATRRAAQ